MGTAAPNFQVTVDEIAHHLQAYLKMVESGQTLVIVKAGKPLAEIKPISLTAKEPRPFGLCAGEFVVPDDFDTPLPDEILKDFEG